MEIECIDVLWNTVSGVINHQIGETITYHDFLHGLRSGRVTGTVSLKSKLLEQLTEMGEEVLYEVFLELRKAYDALGWEQCLDILVGYGFRTCTEHLLHRYWKLLAMVVRAALKGSRGITQVNPLSSKIFNIVFNAVICHWGMVVVGEDMGPKGFGRYMQNMAALF